MMWLLVPLLSSLSHALAATFEKKSIKYNEPVNFLFFSLLTIFLMMLPFTPLYFQVTNWGAFLKLIAAIVLVDGIGNLFYIRAFKKDEASYCLPIRSMTPFFTILFAFFLAPAEMIPLKGLIALIAIILSAYILNVKNGLIDPILIVLRKNNIYLLVATIFFGFSSLIYKSALAYANPPTMYFLRVGLMVPFVLLFTGGRLKTPKKIKPLLVAQVFYIITFVSYFFAISSFNLLISVTLGNLAPLFLVGISALMLKEKITWQKIVASIIIVAGLLLLV